MNHFWKQATIFISDYEEKARQIHNGLQTFHAIKKNVGKEVTQKHFVCKTLKLLILQFKFWKVQGEGGHVPPQPPPRSYGTNVK